MTSFKKTEELNKLSEEDIKKLLQAPSPLVFEAFRIPKYGFDYMDISEANFAEIEELSNTNFSVKLRQEYDQKIASLMAEIRLKITSGCNFLLILQNTFGPLLERPRRGRCCYGKNHSYLNKREIR